MRGHTPSSLTSTGSRGRALGRAALVLLLSSCVLPALTAGPAAAQTLPPRVETAALPDGGELRIGSAPAFHGWSERFTSTGDRAGLGTRFDGPLLDRIYPGVTAVLERVNADADALGFDPLSPVELSLGALDVRHAAADVRTVPLEIELGVLDRLALDVFVPARTSNLEVFAAYDSTAATVGAAAAMLPGAGAFFDEISGARADLRQRVESGTLSAEEEETARTLLASSGAFADALQRRVTLNAPLPLGSTPAGTQILSLYGSLIEGFAGFDLTLPELGLPITASSADLQGFFSGSLLESSLPGNEVRGWGAGGLEIGLRLGLLDGFGGPGGGDRGEGGTDLEGVDTEEPATSGDRGSGLRLRTSVGIRARFSPPASLLTGPVGAIDVAALPMTRPGERDLELSLYQDAKLGDLLIVNAVARYGLPSAHRFETRVRSPERPFAVPETERTVERTPGDYQRLRLSPRLMLEESLSLGLSYAYWRRGVDEVRIVEGGAAGVEASALELGTRQERHRLGVAVELAPRPGEEGAGVRLPEVGVRAEFPLAGSGGMTPASSLYTFHLRLPIRIF